MALMSLLILDVPVGFAGTALRHADVERMPFVAAVQENPVPDEDPQKDMSSHRPRLWAAGSELQLLPGAFRLAARNCNVPLAPGVNQGWMDDRWVRDATTTECLPFCIDNFDELKNSIATGETIDGFWPYLWSVTSFYYSNFAIPHRAILISYSDDGGANWYWHSIIHSPGGQALSNPDIAVDPAASPDRLYIAYESEYSATDHDACIAAMSADGSGFVSQCTEQANNETRAKVAVEYSQTGMNYAVMIHEFWASSSDSDIDLYRSTDGGYTWTGVNLAYSSYLEYHPDIASGADASGNSYFHAVYVIQAAPNYHLRYRRSLRGDPAGYSAGVSPTVAATPLYHAAVQASHGGGRVLFAATWQAAAGNDEITFNYSVDNGASWPSPFYFAITNNQRYPALATENSGRTNSDPSRNIFWMAYRTDTGLGGRIEAWQADASDYATWYSDTPALYVDDESVVVDASYSLAITDIQDFYPGITFNRQGANQDVYYGTKGDTYTLDAKFLGSGLHVDIPLEIDSVSVSSPAVYVWPAFGEHDLFAPDGDASGWHYAFSYWSDGGAQSHSITSEYAILGDPLPVIQFDAFYGRCTLTPPEVPLILCDRESAAGARCSWTSPPPGEQADDYAVWRSEDASSFSGWAELGRTSGASEYSDSDHPPLIYFYLVRAICGSGTHDHTGPLGHYGQ